VAQGYPRGHHQARSVLVGVGRWTPRRVGAWESQEHSLEKGHAGGVWLAGWGWGHGWHVWKAGAPRSGGTGLQANTNAIKINYK